MSNDSTKIYTRTGDKGKTSLIGGLRVSKSDLRLEAYGTIDELNSVIGLMIAQMRDDLCLPSASAGEPPVPLPHDLDLFLRSVQNELFNVGSQLACEDEKIRAKLPGVHEAAITAFENKIDELGLSLEPLKNFILPGGCKSSGFAHVARTVCRRAERACVALLESDGAAAEEIVVRYVNRLSDFLFTLARFCNASLKIEEPIWTARTNR